MLYHRYVYHEANIMSSTKTPKEAIKFWSNLKREHPGHIVLGEPASWIFTRLTEADSGWQDDRKVYWVRAPRNYGIYLSMRLRDHGPCDYLKPHDHLDDGPRFNHRGWWLHPDGDIFGTARGWVFQLPSRKKVSQFVPAVFLSDQEEYLLHMDDLYDNRSDAAHRADGLAESYAYKEREYYQADMDEQAAEEARQELRDREAEDERTGQRIAAETAYAKACGI
jgi:hypothetical protein